jgi:hypothetical protein
MHILLLRDTYRIQVDCSRSHEKSVLVGTRIFENSHLTTTKPTYNSNNSNTVKNVETLQNGWPGADLRSWVVLVFIKTCILCRPESR